MSALLRKIRRFVRSEDGPTAVEYAVMLALIMMACIGAVMILGEATRDSFSDSQNKIVNAMQAGGSEE